MLELAGHITEEGKLTVYNQQALTEWRMSHSGKDVVLSLKEKRLRWSLPQNGYYWKVVVPMVRDAMNKHGNDFSDDETHEFLKGQFNYKEADMEDGYTIKVPQSTSRLDSKEFGVYVDRIQQFASMVLGVYIPSPNEQMQIDFYLNQ